MFLNAQCFVYVTRPVDRRRFETGQSPVVKSSLGQSPEEFNRDFVQFEFFNGIKTRVLTSMDNCKNETYPKPSVLLRVEVKDLYMNDWMEGEVVWDIDIDIDSGDKKIEQADNINDMFNLFF
jgi:hypothetical protein